MPLKTFQELVRWLEGNTDLRSTAAEGTRESTSIEEKVYMFLYLVGNNASSTGGISVFRMDGD